MIHIDLTIKVYESQYSIYNVVVHRIDSTGNTTSSLGFEGTDLGQMNKWQESLSEWENTLLKGAIRPFVNQERG